MYSFIASAILFLSFVNIVFSESHCLSSQCPENEKVTFLSGHTYVYEYDIHVQTQKSVTNNESNIDRGIFNSIVEIHADKSCNLFLKLYNATFNSFDENDKHNYTVEALSKDSLIFHYVDGKIIEVCSKRSEAAWITNIKLGILSSLQYTLSNDSNIYNVSEENMNGDCNSNYTITEVDGWKVIRRFTNLDECIRRTTFITKYTNLFDDRDESSIDGFSRSTQKCRHVLGTMGVPILITCRENHSVTPYDNLTNISLQIKQKLDLDRVVIKNELFTESLDEFSSNEYQYAFTFGESDSINNKTEEILNYIKLFNEKHDKRDNFYMTYIYILKSLSYDQMKEILSVSEPKEKEFFLQSLENVINENSSRIIFDTYSMGGLSDEIMYNYIINLPYVQDPSAKLMEMMLPMINKMKPSALINLSLSTVIKNYCKTHSDCLTIPEIQNFIKNNDLYLNMKMTDYNMDDILLSLLSLENIGYTYSTNLITSIYLDKTLPEIIRIAAIRSLKRMPCLVIQNDELINLFTDQNNQDVLRKEAFIIITKCIRHSELTKIAHTLSKEDINQVTLFVWNYLFKLNEKSAKSNEVIYQLLENDYLKRKFKGIDHSYRFIADIFNISSELNNDITIITDSKKMKMKQFNVLSSIDIFEKTFDVFKFDGYYEKTTGTQNENCFHSQKLDNNLEMQKSENSNENLVSDLESTNDFSDFHAYISLLGNEIYFSNVSFSHKHSNRMFKKPIVDYKQNFQIFDVSYVVSTTTGLPLTFTIRGDLDISMMTRLKYKDWSFCKFNPLKNSSLVILAKIESSISLVSFLEKIHVESVHLFENNPLQFQ